VTKAPLVFAGQMRAEENQHIFYPAAAVGRPANPQLFVGIVASRVNIGVKADTR
jgi:hypothetical protein